MMMDLIIAVAFFFSFFFLHLHCIQSFRPNVKYSHSILLNTKIIRHSVPTGGGGWVGRGGYSSTIIVKASWHKVDCYCYIFYSSIKSSLLVYYFHCSLSIKMVFQISLISANKLISFSS